jgi:hypothetical protein
MSLVPIPVQAVRWSSRACWKICDPNAALNRVLNDVDDILNDHYSGQDQLYSGRPLNCSYSFFSNLLLQFVGNRSSRNPPHSLKHLDIYRSVARKSMYSPPSPLPPLPPPLPKERRLIRSPSEGRPRDLGVPPSQKTRLIRRPERSETWGAWGVSPQKEKR